MCDLRKDAVEIGEDAGCVNFECKHNIYHGARTPRYRTICGAVDNCMYNVEGVTFQFDEIGDALGISKQAAHREYLRALEKVKRNYINRRKLEQEMEKGVM